MPVEFEHPVALALLPLALLPLLRRTQDALPFSSAALLPADRYGQALDWLWRAVGVLALAAAVVGLAGPGVPGARLQRLGRGAEILILFDRSSSMDSIIAPQGVMGAGVSPEGASSGGESSGGGSSRDASSKSESKNGAARELLTQFVTRRPDDRFALMTFGTSVMPVAPFTDHNQAVVAGLAATAVGRGLPSTNLGTALLAGIEEFRHRSYSGSRIIVLVSDGGAKLDAETRRRIQDGLSRNRIDLDFVYIRNNRNSPGLLASADAADASEEVALHRFFATLPTPYHLYQAEDSNAIAAALTDIDRQQNLPLSFFERVPVRELGRDCFVGAALACALLVVCASWRLRAWS